MAPSEHGDAASPSGQGPPSPETLLRVQMEYMEMPGLKLTLRQARRLWDLPLDLCESVLATLVDRGFLVRTGDGSFLRRGTGPQRLEAAGRAD